MNNLIVLLTQTDSPHWLLNTKALASTAASTAALVNTARQQHLGQPCKTGTRCRYDLNLGMVHESGQLVSLIQSSRAADDAAAHLSEGVAQVEPSHNSADPTALLLKPTAITEWLDSHACKSGGQGTPWPDSLCHGGAQPQHCCELAI
jgi:hypothetical protein